MNIQSKTKRIFFVAALTIITGAGLWLLSRPGTITPSQAVQNNVNKFAGEDYFTPGGGEAEEGELLLELGDYWATRVSYPTGQFQSNWLLDAAKDDALVPRGIPAGRITYEPGASGVTLDPTKFTALGPQPLEGQSWGDAAGRTNVIASDPVSPTIAYLGSDGGGVWKTENCCSAATTWTPVTDAPIFSSIAIGDIYIDPNDHLTVYAGTGDLRYGSFSFGAAGLLKTTDGGDTWEILGEDVFNPVYPSPVGDFPQYNAIGKVRVDPRDSNTLIVGTKIGVYFSYDQGTNWAGPCLTNPHTTQRQDITGLIVSDNGSSTDLWAAVGTRGFNTTVQPDLDQNGANGIYKTTVPGSGCPGSWTLQATGWPAGTGGGTPFPTNVLGRIDMTQAPSNPNVLYAQVQAISPNRGGQLGVWRSGDGGATWTQQSNSSNLNGCFGDYGQNWYDQGVKVDPNNEDIVYISTVDLFKSTDGGASFWNVTCGYAGGNDVHVDHHAIEYVDGDSSRLLIGTDGGAYYSSNADLAYNLVTFINLNETLNTIEFYSGDITGNFATSPAPGANGGAQDNGSMVNIWDGSNIGPEPWSFRTGGDGMYARIEPVNEMWWYQESQWGNMRISQTGPFGSYLSISEPWAGDRVSFVFPYEIYKYNCPGSGCKHLIGASERVWETITGGYPGSAWYANSPDLTKGTLADRSFVNQLSFAFSDESVVIAGTNDGNVQYAYNMGTGTANTGIWIDVTDGNAVLPNRPVLDVTTDPVNPWIGYAALGGFDQNTPSTPGHVYQVTCTAACATFEWKNKSGNLPNVPIDSIMPNPNYPKQIFAGSDWGLYYTDDITVDAPEWKKFTEGLPSVMIWDMSIDRGYTTLALFTRSRGAYAWPLPDGPISGEFAGIDTSDDDSQTGPQGSVLTYTISLTNTGNITDTFDIALGASVWTTTLSDSDIEIQAGASAVIEVYVTVGSEDTDMVAVTVTSQFDTGVSASVSLTSNRSDYEIYLPLMNKGE